MRRLWIDNAWHAGAGGKCRQIVNPATREGGKPRIENVDEVEWCAAC